MASKSTEIAVNKGFPELLIIHKTLVWYAEDMPIMCYLCVTILLPKMEK